MIRSKAAMADWDTDLRIGRNAFTLNTCGVTLPVPEDNISVIGVVYIDTQALRKPWPIRPQGYK